MSDHGIYKDGHFMIVCGSKEKAIEMLENYPEGEVYPVEQVNGKWVKKE